MLRNKEQLGDISQIRWSKADGTVTPIAVFAFNRLDLLRKTLKCLELCEGFPTGPIFVFSDAARVHVAGEAEKVEVLRKWLRDWCIQNDALLIEADRNRGLRQSIIEGVSGLLLQYEQAIVLEDDIIVSRCFLQFMMQALTTFRGCPAVCQVSGYFIPHRQSLADIGFLAVPACWGWATWRRSWQHYDDDAAELLSRISEASIHRFNIDGSYSYYDSLRRNAEGTQNTWLVRWYASVFLREGLTVYPSESFTRNIGFEAGGTNCSEGVMARVFCRQKVRHTLPMLCETGQSMIVAESMDMRKILADFYLWQQHQWSKPSQWDIWAARLQRLKRMISRK